MGLFSKSSKQDKEATPPPVLEPVHPPLEVFAGCTRDQQVTLVIRSKIAHIKDDHFLIIDEAGVPLFKVGATNWSLKELLAFSKLDGEPLFKMNMKNRALKRTFLLEDGPTEYVKIERKHRAWKHTLHARITSTTVGNSPTLELVGSHTGTKATITIQETGQVVCVVRHEEWKQALENKQTSYATVAPGVDLALISTLVMAWDQIKTDDRVVAAA